MTCAAFLRATSCCYLFTPTFTLTPSFLPGRKEGGEPPASLTARLQPQASVRGCDLTSSSWLDQIHSFLPVRRLQQREVKAADEEDLAARTVAELLCLWRSLLVQGEDLSHFLDLEAPQSGGNAPLLASGAVRRRYVKLMKLPAAPECSSALAVLPRRMNSLGLFSD